MLEMKELLKMVVEKEASDLHITEGTPPVLRIDGELVFTNLGKLSSADTKRLVYSILNDEQKARFEDELELDFSLSVPGISRFRVNAHIQKGNVEVALRIVPLEVRSIEELGLPLVVKDLARRPNGLVLVTGPTGMGKTTTLAAMVDLINNERRCLIISIEDPIEYLHHNKKSIVKQREVYSDTRSFAQALKHVLRQDPDVILVGEMRDLETISTTITAAETGHLVLSTLHTSDAPQTVDRLIDVFPSHQQRQIQVQLAGALQGIISQLLLPRADGKGRVVAVETLIATPGVRNLIREHKTEQIPTLIQTGAEFGMQSMDKFLKELYQNGAIKYEDAIAKAKDPKEFRKL